MNGGTKGKTYAAKSAKGRIVNYRPALSCALALVAGILFAFSVTYRRVPSMIAVIIGFTALAATCVFLSPKNGKFVPARLIALLLFFSLGAGEFLVYRKNYRSEFYSGEKEVFAKITERRDYSVGTFFVFDDLSFDGKIASGKLVMFVYTNYDSSFSEIADRLKEGDLIGFGAQISTNTSWLETKDDGSIANRAYYWREDIRYEAEKIPTESEAKTENNADTADGMKTITAIKTESPAKNFLKKCVAFFCVTLSATLFTFPILSVCFSYASGAALLLNVLVVPLVSACFAVFLALAFLACIVAPLAKIILYVPSVLISLLTTFFYAFDFSSSAVALRFTPIAIFAYYAALFLSGDKIRLKPPVRIALVSCCTLAFVLSFAL